MGHDKLGCNYRSAVCVRLGCVSCWYDLACSRSSKFKCEDCPKKSLVKVVCSEATFSVRQ